MLEYERGRKCEIEKSPPHNDDVGFPVDVVMLSVSVAPTLRSSGTCSPTDASEANIARVSISTLLVETRCRLNAPGP